MAKDKLSYYDVVVYANGVRYIPADNYSLHLQCTKIAGWQLWQTAADQHDWKLLGGEYEYGDFCIEVAGYVILGVKPMVVKEPEPFGWTGAVVNDGSKVEFK